MTNTASIDYRYLQIVDQIIERAPALTRGGMRYWIFRARKNGLEKALVKIDRNVFIDTRAFNKWLAEGKATPCDYRNLRTIKQILQTSHFKESKLRYWLQHAHENGLEEAIIRKNPKKLLIDIVAFNDWLFQQNTNAHYTTANGEPRPASAG